MKEQPVKWFRNPAERFLELLKTHTWNEAVRILRSEKAKIICENCEPNYE